MSKDKLLAGDGWRELKRHPLSAEYADIAGKAWERFVENFRQRGNVGDRPVVLSDGMVLDGWQLLKQLVKPGTRPPFPVVILTATLVISREWAESHGCAGFLRKPVETAELLAEVQRCLGRGSRGP